MLTLPTKIITLLAPFAPLSSPAVFARASLLVLGAIPSPGQRTVAAALLALGLEDRAGFQNYHRVLNRAA